MRVPCCNTCTVCAFQADIDWGSEAWIESAIAGLCRFSHTEHEEQASRGPPAESTPSASVLDQPSLYALLADCTGLLILYFTCVPSFRQVKAYLLVVELFLSGRACFNLGVLLCMLQHTDYGATLPVTGGFALSNKLCEQSCLHACFKLHMPTGIC